MAMKWAFRSDRPIYAQLVEQIQVGILNGEYPPGSAMPSVRALAPEAGVNPNTMQRALAELETQGMLRSNRTAGRYVTEDEDMILKLRERLARAHIETFLTGMRDLGIDGGDALGLMKSAIESVSGQTPERMVK